MSVVLRGEELIFRRQRPVNLPDVELAAVGGRGREGLGQIRERDEDLALRQDGQRPFRQAQCTETGDGKAALQNAPTTL